MSLSEITAKFTYADFFSLHNVKSTLQRFVFLFPVSLVVLIQTSSISDSSMFLELHPEEISYNTSFRNHLFNLKFTVVQKMQDRDDRTQQ